jgi:hypothetical protein
MTKPISVFVCGRQRPESCESPDCGQTSVATCDYPLRGKKAGKNCGKRLCARCRIRQAPGVDFCEAHDRASKTTVQR